jgi:hypothetical protein
MDKGITLSVTMVRPGPVPSFEAGAYGCVGRSLPSVGGSRVSGVSTLDVLKRTIRAVRMAATDSRIPRPLRWLAALGLAPIPGPFDEALLLIVAVPLALFYREPLREAWKRSEGAAR